MMEQFMNEIVDAESVNRVYIKQGLLLKHTNQVSFSQVSSEQWSRARHLYIEGSKPEPNGRPAEDRCECHVDSSQTWFLIRFATPDQIRQIIAACSDRLEKLDIRFTEMERLDLSNLTGLRWLQMVKNNRLSGIGGLEQLTGLEVLMLNNTTVGQMLDVSMMTQLRRLELLDIWQLRGIKGLQQLQALEQLQLGSLGLIGTLELNKHPSLTDLMLDCLRIHTIRLKEQLPVLHRLCINNVFLEDADFVRFLPCVEELILLKTCVTSLPDLGCCPGLKLLDITDSPVAHMGGLPAEIEHVTLSKTKLLRLPAFLRGLTKLKRLGLEHLDLEEFPSWLAELGLCIKLIERSAGDGIALWNTRAAGVDLRELELLSEGSDRGSVILEKMRCWFASRGRAAQACAAEYAADEDVLDFRMRYDRLPGKFFTRLWGELWQETDADCVWEMGVRFVRPDTQISAVVFAEDNTLRFLVRRSHKSHDLNDYLCHIRAAAERIAEELGVSFTDARYMYKLKGKIHPIKDESIKRGIEYGLTEVRVQGLTKPVPIDDIRNQNNGFVDKDRDVLLGRLMRILGNLQKQEHYRGQEENSYTDAVAYALGDMGYSVSNQSRAGISATGKSAGLLDMEIRKQDDYLRDWTIYEALILTSSSKSQLSNLDKHLKKVMDNYNPKGLPFVLLVSYVQCEMGKFGSLYEDCYCHISQHVPEGYRLMTHKDMTLAIPGYEQNEFLRIAECSYDRDGYERVVYFLFARFDLSQKPEDRALSSLVVV